MKPLFQSFCLTLSLVLVVGPGCEKPNDPGASDSADNAVEKVAALEPLTMLVVGEEGVGEAIQRQWVAREDGEVSIVNVTLEDLKAADFAIDRKIDIIVFPPGLMGELVSRDRLMEVPKEVANDTKFFNKKEILAHSRSALVEYGNTAYAVPLGSPQWVMLYRSDVLKALNVSAPRTWDEFNVIAEKLNGLQTLEDDSGQALPTEIAAPLSAKWAGDLFLARSISFVRFRGNLSAVFNRKTMEPMINTEPFVKALEDLKANHARGFDDSMDPKAAFQKIAIGEAAIAITWPSATFTDESNTDDVIESIEIARLPGSAKVFKRDKNSWDERDPEDSVHVANLGFEGLVASISSDCGNQLSAYQFLKWLPSKAISLSALSKSPRTGPFRASHLGNPTHWSSEMLTPECGDQYAEIIRDINGERVVFVFPRIHERDEYLNDLGNAVLKCLQGEATAKVALDEAAYKWKERTERIGLRAQARRLSQSNDY